MARDVKGQGPKTRRTYDASGRRAAAEANRRAVVDAARRLFLDRGYGATTVAAIAREAGVSAETVYGAFGSKAGLLHKVWDVTVGGDDQDVVLHERPEVMAIRNEPDLRRRLELQARFSTSTARRIAPFQLMVQAASGADESARAILEEMGRQRWEGIGVMAREAARTGQLAVSEEECRAIVWSTTDGLLWHRLVAERGWTDERYAAWLAQIWIASLVDGRP